MEDEHRYRLVVLGAGRVGKSSIIQRFLNSKFLPSYKPTVEDLHCRNFNVNGSTIKVDILDTAGNLVFPAMRRLSISTAHAFLLVFAVDDRESFLEVKQLWDQIREQRSNYQDLPCVVAANKCDLASSRLIAMEEPSDWSRSQGIDKALLEVSAKNNENIQAIFRTLLQQATAASVASSAAEDGDENDDGGLESSLKRHCSANSARLNPHMLRLREKEEVNLSRSRSLIRRVKKPKVKDRSVSPYPTGNDCTIC